MSLFKRKATKINELEVKPVKTSLKIGLALSGGGTRGFAYFGAFRALAENGINFDYIAGTSAGALMGAVYASGIPLEEVIEKVSKVSVKDVLTSKIKFVPSKTDKFEELVSNILNGRTFDNMNIPLMVIATDIVTGKELRINKGNLAKALVGSCAVPIVFKPVDFGKYRLYDGMLVNNIPADAVRDMGADIVISFDMNPDRGYGTSSTKFLEEVKAALRILMKSNSANGYVYSDLVVKLDLSKFDRSKLDDMEELINQGYVQTMKQMPQILAALDKVYPNEDIKKTEKRVKTMQKIKAKFEKKQQKLIKKGVLFDPETKRIDSQDILTTK